MRLRAIADAIEGAGPGDETDIQKIEIPAPSGAPMQMHLSARHPDESQPERSTALNHLVTARSRSAM